LSDSEPHQRKETDVPVEIKCDGCGKLLDTGWCAAAGDIISDKYEQFYIQVGKVDAEDHYRDISLATCKGSKDCARLAVEKASGAVLERCFVELGLCCSKKKPPTKKGG
jgi:hypothetical protein